MKEESNQKCNGSDNEGFVWKTDQFKRLLDIEKQFKEKKNYRYAREDQYNVFSIIDKNDQDRLYFSKVFQTFLKNVNNYTPNCFNLQISIQRAVACFLGLAICDALGSCTQFQPFDKERTDFIKKDFLDIPKNKELGCRSGKSNIWTDDCSMALSLADSILLNNLQHNPKHTRFMYHFWLHYGLNNGGRPYSIGLGGNISISTRQFQNIQEDFTQKGNQFNNGNGSLMRLAPVPITYFRNEQKALRIASEQSRTTHNGRQARECCRLLTLIIVRLIKRNKFEWKSVIQQACADFKTDSSSVKCLAMSKQESIELFQQQCKEYKNFDVFNKGIQDRNWNWKDINFTYSPFRAENNPGYVGSYCMDALSMALHTVWFGESFHQIALKNANMGGDCDTVGAIAGQIAGAIYGLQKGLIHLYSQTEDCIQKRYQVFLKALKLSQNKKIPIN